MDDAQETEEGRPLTNRPVGALCFWVEPAHPEDSLRSVVREMSELGSPLMPVVVGQVLVGAITEKSIAAALAAGVDPDSAAESVMDRQPNTILVSTPGREALAQLAERNGAAAVVTDASGVPIGVLTPACFVQRHGDRRNFSRIGGMATPFGVYLTNGVVSGGPNQWALVGTGAVMFLLLAASGHISLVLFNNLGQNLQTSPLGNVLFQFTWTALFFVGMRSVPLAGTHAAEHMVVHAIERGERLIPEVVGRMPRVHPRCGTNLAVAATLFLGIMTWESVKDTEVRLLIATVTTLTLWRPLGSLLQFWVTTKPPTPQQLSDGIQSGKQLIEHMESSQRWRPTVFHRIVKSGLLQIFIGAGVVELALFLLYEAFRVPQAWRIG